MFCSPKKKEHVPKSELEKVCKDKQACENELAYVKKQLQKTIEEKQVIELSLTETKETFEKEVVALSKENELLQKQITDTREVAWRSFKERNGFEEELQKVRGDNVLLQMEVDEAKREAKRSYDKTLNENEGKLMSLSTLKESCTSQLIETRNKLEKMMEERRIIERQLIETEKELKKINDEHRITKTELSDTKIETTTLKSKLKKRTNEKESFSFQLNTAKTQVDRIQNEHEKLEIKIIDLTDMLEKANKEKKLAVSEQNMTKRRLDIVCGDKKDLEDELYKIKGEVKLKSREINELSSEHSFLRTRSVETSSENEFYRCQLQSAKNELNQVQSYVDQSKSLIWDMKNDLAKDIIDARGKFMSLIASLDEGKLPSYEQMNVGKEIPLSWKNIEEQLASAINDFGTPLTEQALMLEKELQANFADEISFGKSDYDYDLLEILREIESRPTVDKLIVKKGYDVQYANLPLRSAETERSNESINTVVYCGNKGAISQADISLRKGSDMNDGFKYINAIIEQRKFEELKKAIITKNRYINAIIQQMIEDVNQLKANLPVPRLFGRKKASVRKEIINRLHLHLTAAVSGHVDI